MGQRSRAKRTKRPAVTKRIRQLQQAKGLTGTREFAEKVGLGKTTIAEGLRSDEWSRATIEAIADSMGLEVSYLLHGPSGQGEIAHLPEGGVEIPGVGRAAADSSGGRTVEFDHDTPPVHIPRHTGAVEIRGHSLYPVAWDGQHVLVDMRDGQSVSDGELAVVETHDGRTYARRLHTYDEHVTLFPVNPALRDHSVTLDRDEIKRAHKIVGVWFE